MPASLRYLHNVKILYTSLLILSKTNMEGDPSLKAAFPRAKFLYHISHALQSLLTDFCGIITVHLYSRTDTDEKWINNNYNFGINDCRACNLWQRKFGRVLEPLYATHSMQYLITYALNKFI